MKPFGLVYTDHDKIPPIICDYILTVVGESDIKKIPLTDINGYFAGAQENFDAFLEAKYNTSIPTGSYEGAAW